QACLLILNRKTDYYRKLRSILVYPSAFIVNREIVDDAGVHTSWREPRIGESWEEGRVIISWDEVEPDERDRDRGENVVLHEFAHQLD
ncbi:MAG: zinc-dependent peptidase, partial [Gammaproteobacteria bacterium]